MNTKEKIIAKAIQLFNNNGFGAVSLFEIANSLSMSRGNLTYHFKDKDQLLLAITAEVWGKLERKRQESLQVPSFKNLHNEIQLFYQYQKEYAFIFMDHHVLTHPMVRDHFRKITNKSIEYSKNIIAFSIELGNMKEEAFPGLYNHLAMVTWMSTFFWLPQQVIRGEKKTADAEKVVWSMLLPHLTKKGLTNFKKFFGQDYISELGEPFDINIENLITI